MDASLLESVNPANNLLVRQRFRNAISVYYISDIHMCHRILHSKEYCAAVRAYGNDKYLNGLPFGNADFIVNGQPFDIFALTFAETMGHNLACQIPDKTSDNDFARRFVFFLGDIAETVALSEAFYRGFMTALVDKWCRVFAVLGNHEIDSAVNARNVYAEMFQRLDISFLDNNSGTPDWLPFTIFGGTGFAGYNEAGDSGYMSRFNKTTLSLSEEEELIETKKFEALYHEAVANCVCNGSLLICVTHNPLTDWLESKCPDINVVYFNGHTHKNYSYVDNEAGIAVYADNQVGYKGGENIHLQNVRLYEYCNPFVSYADGIHEVIVDEYLQFLRYLGESKQCNRIQEYIRDKGFHFYVIKRNGYYGFFLINDEKKKAYICNGGRPLKISAYHDIEYFNQTFLRLVNVFQKAFEPYRRAQERVAKFIRSFGGNGKIHGFIVDIDGFNHIMMNPLDGSITFYMSPMFGTLQTYNSLTALLKKNCPELLSNYNRQLQLLSSDHDSNLLRAFESEESISDFIQLDIKDSLYAISMRYNKFQALFDSHVLRAWTDNFDWHNFLKSGGDDDGK